MSFFTDFRAIYNWFFIYGFGLISVHWIIGELNFFIDFVQRVLREIMVRQRIKIENDRGNIVNNDKIRIKSFFIAVGIMQKKKFMND